MKPPPFTYRRPRTLDEAVSQLAESDGEAKVLAGGQSLVPLLNFRLLAPQVLVDINGLEDLDGVKPGERGLRIGALTRHRTVETSALVRERCPVLASAAAEVGHLAIRNRGTFGGSLAHNDPAAEFPLVAVLLDAEIQTASPSGERSLSASDFFVSYLATALEPDELIVSVEVPSLPAHTSWGFEEFSRRYGDFALAAAAATLTIEDGEIQEARIALAGVGLTAFRASAAEELLVGERMEPELLERAADAARDACDPTSDLHASADLRRHLAGVLTRRALSAASPPGQQNRNEGTVLKHNLVTVRDRPLVTPSLATPEGERVRVRVSVNGESCQRDVEPRLLLGDFLRDELGLVGTHFGCEQGVCGACTVLLDGDSVRSCLLFAAQADGAEITTVEGLADGDELHPLQQAFWENHGLQCGYCTSACCSARWTSSRRFRGWTTSVSARVSPATSAAAPATRTS